MPWTRAKQAESRLGSKKKKKEKKEKKPLKGSVDYYYYYYYRTNERVSYMFIILSEVLIG